VTLSRCDDVILLLLQQTFGFSAHSRVLGQQAVIGSPGPDLLVAFLASMTHFFPSELFFSLSHQPQQLQEHWNCHKSSVILIFYFSFA
jgi:hypothetical protein